MQGYIADNAAGLFLINDKGEVLESWIFSKDPVESVSLLTKIYDRKPVKQEKKFLKNVQKFKFTTIVSDNQALVEALKSKITDLAFSRPCERITEFRRRFPEYAINKKLFKDKEEWTQYNREFALHLARQQVTASAARRDLSVVQMVRAIDDLDKSQNLFAGRIREWYGLHFPELDRRIESHETYLRLITELGARRFWSREKLSKLGIEPNKSAELQVEAENSMGTVFTDQDMDKLKEMAGKVLELYKLREDLTRHIEEVMAETAPNLLTLAGPLIAARLISIAGGVQNLAKLPSSTIQVLGAEKALFRALKTGTRPPKHGVIFQYGPIHQAPRWQRGKIARAFSGKLAIAARVDAFGGGAEGEKLKKDFENRITEIQEKYPHPPQRIKREKRGRQGKKAWKN